MGRVQFSISLGRPILLLLPFNFSKNFPLPYCNSVNIFNSYESPLDNNSVYIPRIEMQNLMGSIYNSFFIPQWKHILSFFAEKRTFISTVAVVVRENSVTVVMCYSPWFSISITCDVYIMKITSFVLSLNSQNGPVLLYHSYTPINS